MSLQQFTLNSDDEIESEDGSDDEIDGNEEVDNEILKASFQFEDGQLVRHNKKEKAEKPKNDVISEGMEDNVRNMPHAEERALRAIERQKTDKEEETPFGMDAETEADFFESVVDASNSGLLAATDLKDITFSQLNLSRPLLRAVEASGYVTPTPIQAQVIPIAMAGRDICASAATGSGKTAAFVLPFLERLLYRPKDIAEIRVLVVTPTRELATQIYEVLTKLAQFCDVTCGLICGGKKDIRSQEALLRQRPDIIVCTPGRIIDHLRNSHSVSIGELDVLVLDEADRLLELGFQSELEELLRHCPTNRQTMLFSATMTSKVDDLACLSLRKPVRVKTSGNGSTVAPRLVQEFIKVRNEDEREAMLTALVCNSGFNQRAIIFFETKVAAHRFYLILKLMDILVAELHGDMTQPMRESSLRSFRDKQTEVLIATDVAARGIDITGIRTVINAEMPRSASTYIHRVGRTARAGSGGRAITLVSDVRRKVMKEVLRGEGSQLSMDGGQVLSRTIPKLVLEKYITTIVSLEERLLNLAKEERLKSRLDEAQRDVERAENMLLHEAEINSRPVRTWYQSVSQKKELQDEVRERVRDEERKAAESRPKKDLTTQELVLQAARRDEYRDDDKSSSAAAKKDHRLSRKKRRRMEALKGEEDDGFSIGAVSKRAKNAAREKENKEKDRLLVPEKKKKSDIPAKAFRPKFAVGGFDQDMNEWNSSGDAGKKLSKKKQRLEAASKKEFTEFDPTKRLKKGGKPGKTSFKSKSKYNRRK